MPGVNSLRAVCRTRVRIELTTSDCAILWLSLREAATPLGPDDPLSTEVSTVMAKLADTSGWERRHPPRHPPPDTGSLGTAISPSENTAGGAATVEGRTPARVTRRLTSRGGVGLLLSCREVWLARVALADMPGEPGRLDRREAVAHALRRLPVMIGPCAFGGECALGLEGGCGGSCASIGS